MTSKDTTVLVISNNDYTHKIEGTMRFNNSTKIPFIYINGNTFLLTSDITLHETIKNNLNSIYRFSKDTKELFKKNSKHNNKSVLSLTRAIRDNGDPVQVYFEKKMYYIVIKTENNKTYVTLVLMDYYNKYFRTC
jgi:hypothetical protein